MNVQNVNSSKNRLEINNVLVALELDSPDRNVLRYLHLISKFVEIKKITFLHILPSILLTNPLRKLFRASTVDPAPIDQVTIINSIKNEIDQYWPQMSIPADYVIKEGSPKEEIIRQANRPGIELVALGKRFHPDTHFIDAKNVIRHGESHILVVPETAPCKIEGILVPVDFSEHTLKSIQYALDLAQTLNSSRKLVLLHIYQRPDLMAFKLSKTPEQLEESIKADHEEAFEKYLFTHFPKDKDRLIPVLLESDDPNISDHIINYALDQQMNLIIQGARGHSGIASFLLGSTTERLLNKNDVLPIIIIK